MEECRRGGAAPRARAAAFAFAGTGTALVAAYAALPSDSLPIRLATGFWALCAFAYGIRAYRPRHAEAWLLLAVSITIYQVADASDFSLPSTTRPGAEDWIAFAGYPLAAAGLVLMVRSRRVGRDVTGLLDALVAAIALAYPAWVFLVEPFVGNAGLSTAVRVASIVPPAGDLVLIWIIARLLVTTSTWSTSIWLLAAGVVVCATADSCEALWRLDVYPWFGTALGQSVVAGGWMGYCLLWGAAALVPSMRENTVPVARRGADLMPARMALLVAVVLVVPVAVIVERMRGQSGGWLALASGTAVTVLIMLRIASVFAQYRQALGHEEALLAASEKLALASGVDEVTEALHTAVERLFADGGAHRSVVAVVQGDGEDAGEIVEAGGAADRQPARSPFGGLLSGPPVPGLVAEPVTAPAGGMPVSGPPVTRFSPGPGRDVARDATRGRDLGQGHEHEQRPAAVDAASRPAPKAAAWCAGLASTATDAAGLLRTEALPPRVAEALKGAGQALAVPIANDSEHIDGQPAVPATAPAGPPPTPPTDRHAADGQRWRKGAIVVAGREYDLLTRVTPLEILAGQAAMSLTRIELNREISAATRNATSRPSCRTTRTRS